MTRIGKNVFIGPAAVITNDPYPMSKKMVGVTIEDGAVIGGGSVIKAGVTVGKNSVVAMGAVVTNRGRAVARACGARELPGAPGTRRRRRRRSRTPSVRRALRARRCGRRTRAERDGRHGVAQRPRLREELERGGRRSFGSELREHPDRGHLRSPSRPRADRRRGRRPRRRDDLARAFCGADSTAHPLGRARHRPPEARGRRASAARRASAWRP